MPNQQTWGRWALDENDLIFRPDAGQPDPGYEISLASIQDLEKFTEIMDQLQGKRWIVPEDLTDIARARTAILKSHFVDEEFIPAPPSLPWFECPQAVQGEWSDFLNTADPLNEALFQEFLEQHPSLLPGPHGTTHGHYHGPVNNSVYCQAELPGFRAKRPDFLLFEQDSATIYAVLIEIEAPGKPWCTSSGTPSAILTRAIDQLRDWKAWFAEPHNVLAFQRLYGVDPDQTGYQRFVQHYILVYGRRADATRVAAFAKKRHDLAGSNEFFMTYDRLEPNRAADFMIRLDRSGPDTKHRLVSISPNFSLNTDTAVYFSSLVGREEAILRNRLISDERKQFLLERIEVADRYAEEFMTRRTSWYTKDGFRYTR
ncbi:MAG TPA: Shedu anti-phage system protein SduA domain-containing protein [Longimicrobiaceae bacterium]|jgi:hypothetical protein|nr:Shedu anti-phage system protein SduA domain-containing protein [Longimicrobiaceae bacterium]